MCLQNLGAFCCPVGGCHFVWVVCVYGWLGGWTYECPGTFGIKTENYYTPALIFTIVLTVQSIFREDHCCAETEDKKSQKDEEKSAIFNDEKVESRNVIRISEQILVLQTDMNVRVVTFVKKFKLIRM